MAKGLMIISGTLVKDPEMRYTPNGTAVTNFPLPVESGVGDKKETTWVKVTLWGARAEWANKNLRKGSIVQVSGEFSLQKWQKSNGETMSEVVINFANVEPISNFGSSKNNEVVVVEQNNNDEEWF